MTTTDIVADITNYLADWTVAHTVADNVATIAY